MVVVKCLTKLQTVNPAGALTITDHGPLKRYRWNFKARFSFSKGYDFAKFRWVKHVPSHARTTPYRGKVHDAPGY